MKLYMAEIQSHSEITSHNTRKFFIPSYGEIALYILFALILLIGLNAGSLISNLSNDYIGDPQHLKTNFSTLFNSFSDSFSSAAGGRLGQIIVWSFVGAISYIGLWLAKNVLNSFENDVIADHYLHPSNYSRLGYWGSSFSIKIFLAALILITAGFLFLCITGLLPAFAALAGSAAYNFQALQSSFYIFFSVLGTAILIYINTVLIRLISHLWKLL